MTQRSRSAWALLDHWLPLDPKPERERGRGRPLDWRTGVVFPMIVRQLRQDDPSLTQRGAESLLADYLLNVWVPAHEAEAGAAELLIDKAHLIERIHQNCKPTKKRTLPKKPTPTTKSR